MNKTNAKIKKRIPIRRRFLTTVLLTTTLAVLAASVTGYTCIRWIRSATEQTLTEQLEINLKRVIQEKVHSVDARLEHYEKYVELMVDSIASLYADEAEMISTGKLLHAPQDTREYAMTRTFASRDLTEDDLRDELRLFSHLESIWEPIAKENESIINALYLGTKDGLMVSYDRFSYLGAQPEGREQVYNYFVSEWYKRGMAQDGICYTDVYMDFQGRGLTITVACSFPDGSGERAGVACIDFSLAALYDELFSAGLDENTFVFALDRRETIISPDSDTLEILEYTGLTLDELDALKTDADGIMEIGDSVYVCIPMERVGWTLCASVSKEVIQKDIHDADLSIRGAVLVFLLIVLTILLIADVAVNLAVRTITHPLELLGRDIKIISDGNLNYRASVYRNDEIGDITSGMNEMVDRLNFTLNELMSSQQHADAMSRLATLDSLTGIRNKTAFDRQAQILTAGLINGEKEFGFVQLDLNNLKVINDNYGHEKGDLAIKKICRIITEVFDPSPVFRVGGDEFVVLLEGENYRNIKTLEKRFKDRMRLVSENKYLEPWERVSAAIGYALYDEHLDAGAENVLARADREMYQCKKRMKGN